MIYIFVALYCEAKPIITRYGLKPDGGYTLGSFSDAENRMKVILTGVGKTGSAAAVAYSCAKFGIGSDDFIINIGTAGGGRSRSGAYILNKITDADSGRPYYPDMIYRTCLTESCCTTVSTVATEEMIDADDNMLWEMEASGFADAARLFMPPDKVQFIKVVSDRGNDNKKDLTDELLENTIADNIDDIAGALEVFLKADEAKKEHVQFDPSIEEEFKCSETMRQDLRKILIYLKNSNRDINPILEQMRNEEIIPAKDRRQGKEALNELKRRIIQ